MTERIAHFTDPRRRSLWRRLCACVVRRGYRHGRGVGWDSSVFCASVLNYCFSVLSSQVQFVAHNLTQFSNPKSTSSTNQPTKFPTPTRPLNSKNPLAHYCNNTVGAFAKWLRCIALHSMQNASHIKTLPKRSAEMRAIPANGYARRHLTRAQLEKCEEKRKVEANPVVRAPVAEIGAGGNDNGQRRHLGSRSPSQRDMEERSIRPTLDVTEDVLGGCEDDSLELSPRKKKALERERKLRIETARRLRKARKREQAQKQSEFEKRQKALEERRTKKEQYIRYVKQKLGEERQVKNSQQRRTNRKTEERTTRRERKEEFAPRRVEERHHLAREPHATETECRRVNDIECRVENERKREKQEVHGHTAQPLHQQTPSTQQQRGQQDLNDGNKENHPVSEFAWGAMQLKEAREELRRMREQYVSCIICLVTTCFGEPTSYVYNPLQNALLARAIATARGGSARGGESILKIKRVGFSNLFAVASSQGYGQDTRERRFSCRGGRHVSGERGRGCRPLSLAVATGP